MPPLADQFVHGVVNAKMVEVKKQPDDLASTMLTKEFFYSTMESYFGKKNCSREDPVGASKITSKSSDEDDPTKSIGIGDLIPTSVAQPSDSEDFSVVTSEEAKSIPTSVQLDSSSQVLSKVDSQKVDSISAGAVKDKDSSVDCMNSPFNEIAKTDVNDFAWIIQIKIGKVGESDREYCAIFFVENFGNLEYLKELLCIFYNKSNCEDCFSLHLDETRSLFDRGVETGAVCKLLDKKLQQGTVLWSKLGLQVTGNNEAGVVRELFDQLHCIIWTLCDPLIVQLRNGSQQSLRMYVVARQYAEPNSTVCEMECSGWAEFLVVGVDRLVGIDTHIELTLKDRESQALLYAHYSIAVGLPILLK
ncbi:hypothetical protein MKX03_000393 [Papaver bracteatum]|nr:hypothetical protein MKX03_000393 [Papaver bracteatum]